MREYKIIAGQMKLEEGTLTLRTPTNIEADEEEQKAALTAQQDKKEKQAESNRNRQKTLRQERLDNGWKQDWIRPGIVAAAKEAAGEDGNFAVGMQLVEKQVAEFAALKAERDWLAQQLREAQQEINSLTRLPSWLRFWPWRRR